jgi:hypothetical protein
MNSEPYEYIKEAELITENNIEEKIHELYDSFLKVKGKRELNLSQEDRDSFEKVYLKNYKKIDQEGIEVMELKNFFEVEKVKEEENQKRYKEMKNEIEKLIEISKRELESDPFPRFLRTEEGMKLFDKNLYNEEIVGCFLQKQFPYTEKDFQNYYITDKDIEFLDQMLKESNSWELVYSNNEWQANGYISVDCDTFLPNLSFAKMAGK